MAELLQADFNAVGFKTTIEKIDTATFLGRMTEGKHQLFLMDGTYSMPDPEELFWTFYGCGNPRSKRWGYCDPKIEDLRGKQTAEMGQEKRKQILWDMQKLLLDETAPAVNYYNRFATVMNKRVKGLSPLPIRALFFEKTYVTNR
jgi:peptide/nickel transport system substrate-binding protein